MNIRRLPKMSYLGSEGVAISITAVSITAFPVLERFREAALRRRWNRNVFARGPVSRPEVLVPSTVTNSAAT